MEFSGLTLHRLKREVILSHSAFTGRSIYPDSPAGGGLQWEEWLQECAATRLVESLLLDASSEENMSDLAVAWSAGWLETAMAAEAAAQAGIATDAAKRSASKSPGQPGDVAAGNPSSNSSIAGCCH